MVRRIIVFFFLGLMIRTLILILTVCWFFIVLIRVGVKNDTYRERKKKGSYLLLLYRFGLRLMGGVVGCVCHCYMILRVVWIYCFDRDDLLTQLSGGVYRRDRKIVSCIFFF